MGEPVIYPVFEGFAGSDLLNLEAGDFLEQLQYYTTSKNKEATPPDFRPSKYTVIDKRFNTYKMLCMKTSIVRTNKSFTTTLPDILLRELDDASKELRVQKNDILVQALTLWNKKRKQALLAESYRKIKNKKPLTQLADEGLEEWNARIELCE